MLPKIAPFDFGDEPASSGESASIQCLVTSGDLPLNFKWLFNGRPISEIFGVSTVKLGKRTYALTIDSVSGKHAGAYTCEVSNAAGFDRFNATLIVNGSGWIAFKIEYFAYFCYQIDLSPLHPLQ